jgi:hypothetical protein
VPAPRGIRAVGEGVLRAEPGVKGDVGVRTRRVGEMGFMRRAFMMV